MISILKKIITISITIILFSLMPVQAETKNTVNIYFFHSKDCSHCKSEINILNTLKEKYSNIKIHRFEVHNSKNREMYDKVRELYDIKTSGVPLTIIGDTYYQGYVEEKDDITFTKTIIYYSKYKYHDQVGALLNLSDKTNYKAEDNIPSLNNFIKDYGNYHLIGNIYTNNLNPSLIAIILGTLSIINPIYIILLTIGITLIIRIKNTSKELISLIGLFLIGILSPITISNSYLKIFNSIKELYNLIGINKFNYYLNYLFALISTNLILIIIIYFTIKYLVITKIKKSNS